MIPKLFRIVLVSFPVYCIDWRHTLTIMDVIDFPPWSHLPMPLVHNDVPYWPKSTMHPTDLNNQNNSLHLAVLTEIYVNTKYLVNIAALLHWEEEYPIAICNSKIEIAITFAFIHIFKSGFIVFDIKMDHGCSCLCSHVNNTCTGVRFFNESCEWSNVKTKRESHEYRQFYRRKRTWFNNSYAKYTRAMSAVIYLIRK